MEKTLKKLQLNNEDIGLRLDIVLLNKFPDLSRNKIQTMIKSSDVLVNNEKVKTGYILRENDEILMTEIEVAPVIDDSIEKVNLNLDIIYEDDDLLVVNKPKDLVVHPASSYKGVTLINGLVYQVDKLSTINGKNRPGIVHRLDKDTSGLMIVAKSDEAHKELAKDISKHKVVRGYYAIVYGTFENSTGTINMPIKRDPSNRIKMAALEGGRNAVTHFKVLEQYLNHSLVDVELETGRTHQIRVHMSKIGHPILGDQTYGPKKAFGKSGQFLHAYKISFMHPIKKEQMSFETELPLYFKDVIKDLV
ncbi:RluA family pseudouridine synthase [Haploplasma axanthum]|uniref:Pseudouridine synthase n=1 Tax=Haploplasma axanthum TaxID=29552 RepID=A0A449BED8_HAPAX|nr:RluA family pseudouridine synthase [Haploplasma axanthum]VEU80795.1 pseudouridylate synthase [Haploplasma axanthum]